MNKSRRMLFGATDVIDLQDALIIPPSISEGIYKCRIIFQETIQSIEYVPYAPRIIRTVQLVKDDDIDYDHKYLDKSRIDQLLRSCTTDDILIVKHNRITDASFANVVFYDGTSWVTPAHPLLRGTKRQLLLETGIIQEEDITVHDLARFQKAAFINAMLDLDERHSMPIENIFGLLT